MSLKNDFQDWLGKDWSDLIEEVKTLLAEGITDLRTIVKETGASIGEIERIVRRYT